MRVQATYTGPDAQRFALEAPPYGADWPDVAHGAEVIFVYEKGSRTSQEITSISS